MDALARWHAPGAAKTKLRLTLKQTVLLVLTCLAALAASGYGHYWWTVGSYFEETDDAYVGGDVTPIAPHVSGFIAQILVNDNQRVRAGQLLIRLDDRDMRAAVAHATAALDEQNATLESLRAKYTLQKSTIAQAAAELNAKAARAAFAKLDAERYRWLAQKASGSLQDAQRSSALARETQASVLASEAGIAAAKQQLDVLDGQIAQAQSAIAQAAAEVRTARLNLGYTEIRSPIDGYVGNRAAQVGAYVAQGAYLLSIVPAHGLWIDANFKEDQVARLRPGQPATIVADVLPGHVFRGHVTSLAPATGAVFSVIPPENATGNFTKIVQRVPVRIALDAGDATLGQIRPGLSTTVSVDTRQERSRRHD